MLKNQGNDVIINRFDQIIPINGMLKNTTNRVLGSI